MEAAHSRQAASEASSGTRSVALAEPAVDDDVRQWFTERCLANRHEVTRVPLHALRDWTIQPDTGNLAHRTGAFFTVEGIDVRSDTGPVHHWQQPIICQPEIGILGMLIRRIDGRPCCLMQAKMEPGNVNPVQFSPTVQATYSNYTRRHGGAAVPYLDYFIHPRRGRVVADVLQSEQGSWFLNKRNRNIVVEVNEEPPEHEDFRWIPLADLKSLFGIDNLVNMDTRTVLSCLVGAHHSAGAWAQPSTESEFELLLSRSIQGQPMHSDVEVLSWLTERRSAQRLAVERIPLDSVRHWRRTAYDISQEQGRYFSIVGVEVTANSREVTGWSQPMLQPRGQGVVAFLTKPINEVLHVLVRAMSQPGLRDAPELGPTVQCRPENYAHLSPQQRPPFLAMVRFASPERIHYDSVLSEEGGRFLHAENRYMVVEADPGVPDDPPPGFLWLTVGQLARLLRHSQYVNVEARSLLACLYSLSKADL